MVVQSNSYPIFSILLVDDEKDILASFSKLLKAKGLANTVCLDDSRQVMETLSQYDVGIILLDLGMPYQTGRDILPIISENYPDITVIILLSASKKCGFSAFSPFVNQPV